MSTTTGPRTFTSTVEANHAADLRAKRDRTHADIAAEYRFAPSPGRIALDRASADATRRTWEGRAMESAVADVLDQAREAAVTTLTTESGDSAEVIVGDLDGATITVTISDLVATATLTLPAGSPS